jgi:hypothetical protein
MVKKICLADRYSQVGALTPTDTLVKNCRRAGS